MSCDTFLGKTGAGEGGGRDGVQDAEEIERINGKARGSQDPGHSLGTCFSAHIPVAFPLLNRDGGTLDATLPLG